MISTMKQIIGETNYWYNNNLSQNLCNNYYNNGCKIRT